MPIRSDSIEGANVAPPHAHPLLPLLQALLAGASSARNTPLNFDEGSLQIVRFAWREFRPGDIRDAEPDVDAILAPLNALLAAMLQDEPTRAEIPAEARDSQCLPQRWETRDGAAENESPGLPHEVRMAAWLDRLSATLRGVDSQALEIVELRAADASNREIAERLGLGLRLVQRIVADVYAALRSGNDLPARLQTQE